MADDSAKMPDVKPEVPDVKPDVKQSGALVVRTPDDAKRHAIMLRGELPPNRERFYCTSCGKDKTLEFDDDEMAALDQNPRNYTGPCWNVDESCTYMTLVPYDTIFDPSVSVSSQAAENKKKAYKEQAEVQAEVFGQKIVEVLGGGVIPKPAEGGGDPAPAAEQEKPSVPGARHDLPDIEGVDLSDLKRPG